MNTDKPIPRDTPQNGSKRSLFKSISFAILIAVLLVSVCATIYIIASPPKGDSYTEFFLLGPNQKADNYPREIDLGTGSTMIVGVTNHEHRPMEYHLAITLSDGNKTEKLYDTDLSLADNNTWQSPVTIQPTLDGKKMKLDFLLYADGNMTVPYRECYLYITVNRQWDYTAQSAGSGGN